MGPRMGGARAPRLASGDVDMKLLLGFLSGQSSCVLGSCCSQSTHVPCSSDVRCLMPGAKEMWIAREGPTGSALVCFVENPAISLYRDLQHFHEMSSF